MPKTLHPLACFKNSKEKKGLFFLTQTGTISFAILVVIATSFCFAENTQSPKKFLEEKFVDDPIEDYQEVDEARTEDNFDDFSSKNFKKAKSNEDDRALAILKTADNHKNHRLRFRLEESLAEALRLYSSILENPHVSSEIKARAKLNIAKIYTNVLTHRIPLKNFDKTKDDVLKLIKNILDNPAYSQDVKSWARRFQAKLYMKGFYGVDQKVAMKNAYNLLHENLDLHGRIDPETRSRTRMQLAKGYLNGFFSYPNQNPITLARALYNDILKDESTTPDARVKAILALVNYIEFYQNEKAQVVKEKRQQLFQRALKEKMSPLLRAYTKNMYAKNFLLNSFDMTPEESRKNALKLMKEAASEENIPDKLKVMYNVDLAENYLKLSFGLSPDQSRREALKIFEKIKEKFSMEHQHKYIFLRLLADYFVKNIFEIAPQISLEKALQIYKDILEDSNTTPLEKAETRWTMAQYYAMNLLQSVSSPALHVATQLFSDVLRDTSLKDTDRLAFKENLKSFLNSKVLDDQTTQSLATLLSEFLT